MSNLEDHMEEQDEITADYEERMALYSPGEQKNPKLHYVSMTWDDWPEGGSYGAQIMADDQNAAIAIAKLQMADSRCGGEDADSETSLPLYWLENYSDDWHTVDCWEMPAQPAAPSPDWWAFTRDGEMVRLGPCASFDEADEKADNALWIFSPQAMADLRQTVGVTQ